MKTYSFTAPDGNVYEIQGPEGQPEQAFQVLQQGLQAGAIKPKSKAKAVIPGQEGEEAPLLDRLGLGIKQSFAGVGNTADTAGTLAWQGLGTLMTGGKPLSEENFKKLNERIKSREEWAGKGDPGFAGKLAGVAATLPMQILNMPVSGVETAKQFIDQGETLGKAYGAGAIDTAGNVAGLALPGVMQGGKLLRAVSGAGINAAQDTATRAAISGIADTEGARDLFAPSWETAGLAAVPGAAMGVAFGKNKNKKTPTPKKDIGAIVASEATVDRHAILTDAKAIDDKQVALLERAIEKQNPKQPTMQVTPDGQAFVPDAGTEAARRAQELNQAARDDAIAVAESEFRRMPEQLQPLVEQRRQQAAQAALEARQAALEQEVAQRTSLDFNAAERARREAASTGLEPWREQQQMAAEQRMPGDNTPLDFTNEPAPYSLGDTPYQYKGGLDFNAAEFQSLPVEKQIQVKEAWKRRNIERQAEQDAVAKQEQRLQEMEDTLLPMEEALREGAYKPTGDGQGPKTRAAKAEAAPRVRQMRKGPGGAGQGGSTVIFGDLAEGIVRAGKAVKAKFTGQVPPKPDTISTPRSAATIAAKQAKAAKANAIGLKDSVYTSPTTFEEVKANPGKDITTRMQDLGAGMYSAIRRNAPNNVLKYTNRLFTEARLEKIKDSVTLITGKGGYNDLLSKLTPEEKIIVAQDSLILDKTGSAWTPEKAQQLGYSPAMKAMMDWRMKANETIANRADAVLAEQGLAPLNRRVSYASSNYDTAYTSLVYVKGKDKAGKDTTKVVLPVNGNSLWEYREALKWAKEKYKGDEFVFTKMERRGLNTESTKKYRGIPKEGIARLLDEMAKLDPAMQEAKAELDAWIEGKTQKLYGHDVHLLRKQGLEGSIGDRPWLDAKRNAQDFFEQEVNHIEEALQYWNYQKPINEARKMAADPEIANKMPNSMAYVDRYLQHVTGVGLNPLGAALNWFVDKAFAAVGKGSGKTIANASNATREAATIWMMGVFNPTFTNVQLTQTLTGMLPEVNRIRSEFGLSPATVGTSFKNSSFNLMMMASADVLGNFDKVDIAPHLKDAYQWMTEHGLTHYNEVEQSHAATQNPKWHTTKKWLSTPIWVPEKITTPQAFMWAVDMLHEGGLRGNDLYLAAYNASKKAMTEYHPDEAPMVYQRLGVVGQHVGGLKKFVHNAVDQQIAYTRELGKHPAAFTTMLGMTFLFMGAMGLAGIGTLDKLSLSMTDKGLRDHYDELFGTSKEAQGMRDGFVSVLSGFDLQTRYSMADLVPNSFGEAVAGPHLSKLYKMGASMYDYGKNRDEMSFREMAKQLVPSGMAGTLEENYLLGDQGNVLDKEAQNKYPKTLGKNLDGTDKQFWRNDKEHLIRELGGPRPIRERLYDEQKYYADVVDRKKTEKRNDASKRMMTNLALGDDAGFDKAMQTYLENDGDMQTLPDKIKTYAERRNLTSKQRAGGLAPGKSVTSIKKFERYQEKP